MKGDIDTKILASFDYKLAEYAIRDITFLTASIFTDTHLISFKKIFNFKYFSFVFWYQHVNGQISFYKDGKGYKLLSEILAKRYLKDFSLAKKTANKLIKVSDEINSFIKQHKTLDSLLKKWDYFYNTYRDFFAYHQAMYYPSEYLINNKNKIKDKKKVDKIVDVLDQAYKYNEIVVPNVEKYFVDLGIGHLSHIEINKEVLKNIKNKPKRRSIALLGGKTYILSFKRATDINKKIQANYRKWLNARKNIKGIIANKGKVKGKVRLIKDLSLLGTCKAGDVLVTTMTRPQYNAAIKKVAAIVTDEGGMLCHASMLAREFGIPCIVGTRNATSILKNGDVVMVDANKGEVKKYD